MAWLLASPAHAKRGPSDESEPWCCVVACYPISSHTVKLHSVNLYFRNMTDSWVSVHLRACWKNFEKVGGNLCIQHATLLQSESATSRSESNHNATACAIGWARYPELKAKRQWAFGSEVYMLTGRKVVLGRVYSLRVKDSHFSTFELFAAVPIYISICFESAAVVHFSCTPCTSILYLTERFRCIFLISASQKYMYAFFTMQNGRKLQKSRT